LDVTAFSLFNSVATGTMADGWMAESRIAQPPLFVFRSRRTGTTLLHELLVLDRPHLPDDMNASRRATS
jgi:hypothetical protein